MPVSEHRSHGQHARGTAVQLRDDGHDRTHAKGALLKLQHRASRADVEARVWKRPVRRHELVEVLRYHVRSPPLPEEAPTHAGHRHVGALDLNLDLGRVRQGHHKVDAREGECQRTVLHPVVHLLGDCGRIHDASLLGERSCDPGAAQRALHKNRKPPVAAATGASVVGRLLAGALALEPDVPVAAAASAGGASEGGGLVKSSCQRQVGCREHVGFVDAALKP
mmetsp:Transcript_149250/g.479278  ORF Transcript_149250/g.479278 Transcript_149250/m.479278 type:complete len:223 (-) Transcript_149250:189-857(-)